MQPILVRLDTFVLKFNRISSYSRLWNAVHRAKKITPFISFLLDKKNCVYWKIPRFFRIQRTFTRKARLFHRAEIPDRQQSNGLHRHVSDNSRHFTSESVTNVCACAGFCWSQLDTTTIIETIRKNLYISGFLSLRS